MTTLIKALLTDGGRKTERPMLPADLGVLFVDDEDAIVKYAKRVLERQGYRPLVASNGAEALEVARHMERLDVLVTDLMMPVMTGDELARQLRQADPDLKVLYLTGFSDRLFVDKPVLWEHEAFLDKPCSIEGLAQAVALLLYGHTQTAPCNPAGSDSHESRLRGPQAVAV